MLNRIRLSAAALAAAGVWTAYTQQQPAQLTVTKLFDDLHVIVGSGGNVAVYDTPEGAILVDDKFERDVPQILEKAKSVTSQPIKYLLNTHLHGDHTGGNAKILAQGTEIVITEAGRQIMEERKMPGLPRLTYSRQFTVRLGGKAVVAEHFGRGHTRTDAFMYFPARKVVHTGDMFVAGAPFVDYSSGGSGVEWPSTIDRVLALDFDTVIPGHGPILKRADLVAWKQTFERVREEIRQAKREGKSKEEFGKTLDVDRFGWKGGGAWARSFGGVWDELK